MRRLVSTFSCLLLLIPVYGCISTQTEQRVGRDEEKKLEETVGLSDHETSASYVAAVGTRLAQHAGRADIRYRFHVVDMDVPNAFALPGGPVYISRGLLALIQSEDELAGVLAHEIGHIEARHAARRLQAATPFAILNVPAKVIGTVAPNLGRLAELPSALAGGLAVSAYSRQQEHEADRIGAALAAQSGWQPAALAAALEALEAESALHKDARGMPAFFATHPTTPDRVSRVRTEAGQLEVVPAPALVAGYPAFLGKLDGLLLGDNPNHGVFVGDRFIHPELRAVVDLPAGWKHRNLPQAVISLAPKSERVGFLIQLDSKGSDPVAAARRRGLDDARIAKGTKLSVNGLPAFRYRASGSGDTLDLMWIAHRERVFLLTGRAGTDRFDHFAPVFEKVFASARPLAPSDLQQVRATRLRVAQARAGETLPQLNQRAKSTWDTPRAAVTNRLDAHERLKAGQHVKVAMDEAFRVGS
jgi:predicted Zn-dependent protease